MEITPEAALQILINLMKRTPMTDAEMVGAQVAVNKIETVCKEWKDFKNPPTPTP